MHFGMPGCLVVLQLRYCVEHAMKGYVTADAAKIVIDRLLEKDFTKLDIARASGVSKSTIYEILRGKQYIQKGIHRSMMELPVKMTGDHRRMKGDVGATRRLRALRRMGYKLEFLESYTGLSRDTLIHISWRKGDINRNTRDIIRVAYEQLTTKPRFEGMDYQAEVYARQQGWLLPRAWDIRRIDDPYATPKEN